MSVKGLGGLDRALKKTSPSVSVVVPTRDRPELLRRAIISILGQNYTGRIECILVFDQSEPKVPPVEMREGRELKVLRNERTPGLAGARNTGVLAARGEFLAFCDDDDEWLPDKLRHQVEALQASGNAAVATCGVYRCYERRVVARLPMKERFEFHDLIRSRQTAPPSTILAKRDTVLEQIGLVDEAIPGSYGEDYEWLLRAARVAPLVAVKEPLVRIYWHRSSYFTGRWKMIIEALTYLLARYPEFMEEPRGLARIYGQIAFAHAALGQRAEARRFARKSLRVNPRELRGYLAYLASYGLVSAETLLERARSTGRGI